MQENVERKFSLNPFFFLLVEFCLVFCFRFSVFTLFSFEAQRPVYLQLLFNSCPMLCFCPRKIFTSTPWSDRPTAYQTMLNSCNQTYRKVHISQSQWQKWNVKWLFTVYQASICSSNQKDLYFSYILSRPSYSHCTVIQLWTLIIQSWKVITQSWTVITHNFISHLKSSTCNIFPTPAPFCKREKRG